MTRITPIVSMPSATEIEAHVRQAHQIRAEAAAESYRIAAAWCRRGFPWARRGPGISAPADPTDGTGRAFRLHSDELRASAEVLPKEIVTAPEERAAFLALVARMEGHLGALRNAVAHRQIGA